VPITPTEAADIARKHGLTLSDAAGLAALANTLDEAETIAARFATPEVDTAARDLTRRLFGRTDQQPDDDSGVRRDFEQYVTRRARKLAADRAERRRAAERAAATRQAGAQALGAILTDHLGPADPDDDFGGLLTLDHLADAMKDTQQ